MVPAFLAQCNTPGKLTQFRNLIQDKLNITASRPNLPRFAFRVLQVIFHFENIPFPKLRCNACKIIQYPKGFVYQVSLLFFLAGKLFVPFIFGYTQASQGAIVLEDFCHTNSNNTFSFYPRHARDRNVAPGICGPCFRGASWSYSDQQSREPQ